MAADADESKFAFLSQLWPNTLCKFWGLHAAAWCGRRCYRAAQPLGPSCQPSARMWCSPRCSYWSQEDAGTALAALAGVYFSFHAAMLWLGLAAFMTLRSSRCASGCGARSCGIRF